MSKRKVGSGSGVGAEYDKKTMRNYTPLLFVGENCFLPD
jgi:hypothetical protein